MSDTALVISAVLGCPTPGFTVAGKTYWLIVSINVEKMVDAISLVAGEDLGEAPSGHVKVYRADYTETLIYGWEPDEELPDPFPAGAIEHVVDGDTLTVLVDGDPVATYHREQYVDRTVVAIDADGDGDGDPVNGLTPQWVLPHGTTFEQASPTSRPV
ncbi:hypothetical protein [Gordonia amicalis]|uniref:hypothetical protein n=1 Tax=Gordonia amicalis TaxID=89053 RepID=UPI0015F503F4|nr:hypothetical protein [Gordonia amicalis]MBA5846174.1 hypothetical protein [Gordonia amicalis]